MAYPILPYRNSIIIIKHFFIHQAQKLLRYGCFFFNVPIFKQQIKAEEHVTDSAVSVAQRQKTSFWLFCQLLGIRTPLVPTHHPQACHRPALLQKPAKQQTNQEVGVAFTNEEIMDNTEAGVLQRTYKQVSQKRRVIGNLRCCMNHDIQ